MNAPCLNYDIVAHMIHIAPWGALNALARSCRVAAAAISPTWADRFVVERTIADPLHPATAQMLPNGLRHGYTRQRAAVMYALGVPTHLHMRYPMANGNVDLSYQLFDTDVCVVLSMRDGALQHIALDQRGKKYVRVLTLRANDYDGWFDSVQCAPMHLLNPQMPFASIGGGYAAIEQPIRETIEGWFAATPSWETVFERAHEILNALAGGVIEPISLREPSMDDVTDPMFPGVVTCGHGGWARLADT